MQPGDHGEAGDQQNGAHPQNAVDVAVADDQSRHQRSRPAAEGLAALIEDRAGPFDLIFIDADKSSTPGYFAQALQLSRPGGLIIVDNVVRDGALADAGTQEAGARGMRRFHELLAAEPRVSATTIQTMGRKGYDGFTLVLGEA